MERLEVKFAAEGMDAKTGLFTGYGAVFGNIDSHGDMIAPGAFADTLAKWSAAARMPSMKMMHGTSVNPFSGSDKPVGVWTEMREDSKGLFVAGKVSGLNTDAGRYNYELMQDGALNSLSIGYIPVKSAKGQSPEVKRVLQVVNLREVSLVPEGSNDRALITSLKSAEGITTIRQFEDFLRDVGGYSNAAAKAIAAGGFKGTDPRDEDDADPIAVLCAAMQR